MKYYSVGFSYPRQTNSDGSGDDEEDAQASRDLWEAEDVLDSVFSSLGLESVHEYSWPDGSLYKFIRTNFMTASELRGLLHAVLLKHHMSVSGRCKEIPADHKTIRRNTVEFEFELAKKKKKLNQ